MCNLYAARDTPDSLPKCTRNPRVIYPPSKDQTETRENKINLHHNVFTNTKPWDSHPYVSPEGHGTTLFEGYQRWPKMVPLGAAMRLTTSHHPLNQELKDNRAPKIRTRTPKSSLPPIFPRQRTCSFKYREVRASETARRIVRTLCAATP